MEPTRTHVLTEIARHRRIPFSTPPVQDARAVVPRKETFGKKTAKLTPDSVRAIRRAWAAGESVADIASRFGVSKMTIRNILNGRSWSDVV